MKLQPLLLVIGKAFWFAVLSAAILFCVGQIALADSVVAWGENQYGQLGNGTTNESNVPVAVVGLTSGVTTIATGTFHSLAVQNGAVYAWGENQYGQLGNGTTNESNVPVAVTSLSSGVTAIAGGEYHSVAIQNGGVYAWGYNAIGQLGNGTTNNSNVPVAVTSLSSGVTAIAAGANYSLAVQNGGVYAWGHNGLGQLGDGNRSFNSYVPAAVVGLTNGVTAVAAGEATSLAVQNGGVYAWGENQYGELGNGTTNNSNVPVAVTSLSSGVTAIAGGEYHSLAVQNGAVYAWGYNYFGQLGDGTTTNRNTPERIDPTDLTNIVAVAAAVYSSYALSYDGSLWVWGSNDPGLGLSSTNSYTFYLTPLHLLPPTGYVFTSIDADADGEHVVATLEPAPLIPGNFNRDGHVDASDVLAMVQALTDLHGYEQTHGGLTDSQVALLGDINGDGKFTNADLQAFLDYLKSGGGSTNPVPEPSTFVLAVLAALLVGGLSCVIKPSSALRVR